MLNKLINADWKLVFDKVGTVLVDRRFWLTFVFPVVFSIGLFPKLAEADPEVLSDSAVAWAELLVGTLVPLLSALILNSSWTKRAPSGLNFKEPKSDSDVLAEAVIKAIKES